MRQQPEKAEQRAIVQLLEALGAKVYVLGTRRRKGDHQGTMQTPGIPDLYFVLPSRYKTKNGKLHSASDAPDDSYATGPTHVWVEVKRKGGRRSLAQQEFRNWHIFQQPYYICGTCDDVQNWLVHHRWLSESQRRGKGA
jgi:hypothetical protein